MLLAFAGLLHFIVAFAILLFGISFFLDYNKEANIAGIFLENVQQVKFRKFYFLKLTLLFLMVTLMLQLLSVDYAIVAAYVLSHITGKKYQRQLGYVAKTNPIVQGM